MQLRFSVSPSAVSGTTCCALPTVGITGDRSADTLLNIMRVDRKVIKGPVPNDPDYFLVQTQNSFILRRIFNQIGRGCAVFHPRPPCIIVSIAIVVRSPTHEESPLRWCQWTSRNWVGHQSLPSCRYGGRNNGLVTARDRRGRAYRCTASGMEFCCSLYKNKTTYS